MVTPVSQVVERLQNDLLVPRGKEKRVRRKFDGSSSLFQSHLTILPDGEGVSFTERNCLRGA